MLRDKGRVIVQGVGFIKRHTRPNPQRNIKGGIAEREAAIHVSNVMMVAREDDTPHADRCRRRWPTARKVRIGRRARRGTGQVSAMPHGQRDVREAGRARGCMKERNYPERDGGAAPARRSW